MIKSTPHAHTNFVDGKSSAEIMTLAAIEAGMKSLGFSEHAPQAFDFEYCLSPESERMYRLEVEWLQTHYKDRIRVYLGIEQDAYSSIDQNAYRYVIGSLHYLKNGEKYVAVDSTMPEVKKLCAETFGGDGLKLAKAYYDELATFIEDTRPDIIAHVDLVRKLNGDGQGPFFDAMSKPYLDIAKQALERLLPGGALLEINTGAIARGYPIKPYPSLPLLRFWREHGGRVIYSSDCHDANQIDCGYDDSIALMHEAGFTSAWALNPDDGALFVEYGL